MKILRLALLAVMLAVGLVPVWAHHSAAMYDFTKIAESMGVVKMVRVINPHMSLTLTVTDGKGAKDVDFEGHSLNNFYRSGWRPNMIKDGDRIKVRYAPRKDGEPGGFVSGFTTAGGQEVAFMIPKEAGNVPPPKGGS